MDAPPGRLSLCLAAAVLLSACSTAPRTRTLVPGREYEAGGIVYRVLGSSAGYTERGIASWYGSDFHGRKTASGEPYDMEKLTAAHRILPLGTFVRVRRVDGRGETVVRINDRGPFMGGRIIDLSRAGARRLGMLEEGTCEVTVEALGEEREREGGAGLLVAREDYRRGDFTVQVGAFTVRENAERLAASLRQGMEGVEVVPFDRGDSLFFRVRAGRYSSLDEAEEGRLKLTAAGFAASFVVGR